VLRFDYDFYKEMRGSDANESEQRKNFRPSSGSLNEALEGHAIQELNCSGAAGVPAATGDLGDARLARVFAVFAAIVAVARSGATA
jgi:hypothetical protein